MARAATDATADLAAAPRCPLLQPFGAGHIIGCGVHLSSGRVFFTVDGRAAACGGAIAASPSRVRWAVSFQHGDAYVVANFGGDPFVASRTDVLEAACARQGSVAPWARDGSTAGAGAGGGAPLPHVPWSMDASGFGGGDDDSGDEGARGGLTDASPSIGGLTSGKDVQTESSVAVMRNHLQVSMQGKRGCVCVGGVYVGGTGGGGWTRLA